ncbi:hypothetical protein JKP88DRAFT_272195 [Tribonema minus]|uniref:Uncharacterized protein n=1 Tax=Tribonema minus TaxID=303371 RepID=A0A836CNC3_9STRA|nr:hypothetical protein JKP88DRAFT_272195 [Tribonema minus]
MGGGLSSPLDLRRIAPGAQRRVRGGGGGETLLQSGSAHARSIGRFHETEEGERGERDPRRPGGRDSVRQGERAAGARRHPSPDSAAEERIRSRRDRSDAPLTPEVNSASPFSSAFTTSDRRGRSSDSDMTGGAQKAPAEGGQLPPLGAQGAAAAGRAAALSEEEALELNELVGTTATAEEWLAKRSLNLGGSLTCLPESFGNLTALTSLDLSRFVQDYRTSTENLIVMDLSGCEELDIVPDLRPCPLRLLRLRDCGQLRAVPRVSVKATVDGDVSGCDKIGEALADNVNNTLNAVLVAAALLATLGYSSLANPTDSDDTVSTPDSLQNHGDAPVALLALYFVSSQKMLRRGGDRKRVMLGMAIGALTVSIAAILVAYICSGLTSVSMWLVVLATAAACACLRWVGRGGTLPPLCPCDAPAATPRRFDGGRVAPQIVWRLGHTTPLPRPMTTPRPPRVDARTGLVSAYDVLRLAKPGLRCHPKKCLDALRLRCPGLGAACSDVRLDGGGNVTPAVDLATAADLILLAPRASDSERDAAARALCDAYGAPEGLAKELMRRRRERRRAGPAAAAAAAVATAAADSESADADADAEPSVAVVAVAAAGPTPDAEAARARESAVRAAAAASLADHLRELATAAHFADMSALEERRREERARARTERLLLEERLAAERRRGGLGPADAPDAEGDSDAAAAAPGPRDFRDEIRAAASRLHVLR